MRNTHCMLKMTRHLKYTWTLTFESQSFALDRKRKFVYGTVRKKQLEKQQQQANIMTRKNEAMQLEKKKIAQTTRMYTFNMHILNCNQIK